MPINAIKLRNFRNHRNFIQEFDPGLNVIIGANGVGKSNIIEAITLLATTKSFRTSDYRNLIEHNREFAAVEGTIAEHRLKIIISKIGRRFQCDQNPIKTSSEFIGLFQAVVFTPEDLSFVTSSPKVRRRLIDSELSKVNRQYLKTLTETNNNLKNRNALLKSDKYDESLLEVLDDRLAELMSTLANERSVYLQDINELFSAKFAELNNQSCKVKLVLKSECQGLAPTDIYQQLKNHRNRDLLTKQTNFGTHRDDYHIIIDDFEAEGYCSQGQTRMLMIALKLVIANLVRGKTGQTPVVLLDDVLSELDLNHQNKLLAQIQQYQQTIITATHLDQTLVNLDKKTIEIRRN